METIQKWHNFSVFLIVRYLDVQYILKSTTQKPDLFGFWMLTVHYILQSWLHQSIQLNSTAKK